MAEHILVVNDNNMTVKMLLAKAGGDNGFIGAFENRP